MIGAVQVAGPTTGAIDAVVTWVDGSERRHRAKRRRYLAGTEGDTAPERVARQARRFRDND